ncbi:MAG: hypothetical protein IKH77_03995 [Clostridia bacterium]|nr:hypothetical protein [Clostridia bacterium]
MSDRIKRISLRLNLDNPEESQAWEHLRQAGSSLPGYGSRNQAIVTAINDHFSRTGSEDSTLRRIEDTIRRTIREEFREYRNEPHESAPPTGTTSPQEASSDDHDDHWADVEAFLDAL